MSDSLHFTEIFVLRYRPPMTAPAVQMPCPRMVPNAMTGILCICQLICANGVEDRRAASCAGVWPLIGMFGLEHASPL